METLKIAWLWVKTSQNLGTVGSLKFVTSWMVSPPIVISIGFDQKAEWMTVIEVKNGLIHVP
jgi:hypothetical protein